MPTVRDGVREDTGVDLAETFNYLLGLCVTSRRRIDEVLAITGTDAEDSRYLVLWRNTNEIDNAALDTWFVHHRDELLADKIEFIYVNGDHTLNALQQPKDTWMVKNH